MSKPRPFFHDRLVLLLLTVNAVLAIFAAITAVLPIMDSSGAFIGEYRSNLGLDAYRAGGALDMVSFAVFVILVYGFQLFTSLRLYEIKKSVSLVVLMLTSVLLIFTLIVTNALLELR